MARTVTTSRWPVAACPAGTGGRLFILRSRGVRHRIAPDRVVVVCGVYRPVWRRGVWRCGAPLRSELVPSSLVGRLRSFGRLVPVLLAELPATALVGADGGGFISGWRAGYAAFGTAPYMLHWREVRCKAGHSGAQDAPQPAALAMQFGLGLVPRVWAVWECNCWGAASCGRRCWPWQRVVWTSPPMGTLRLLQDERCCWEAGAAVAWHERLPAAVDLDLLAPRSPPSAWLSSRGCRGFKERAIGEP